MFRTLCVLALCLSIAAPLPTAAVASPGCNGCNLVDERNFGTWLVGTTVYIDREFDPNIPVTVVAVDIRAKELKVRTRDGRQGWVSAEKLYSAVAVRERDDNTRALGWSALILGLAAGAATSSDNGNNRSRKPAQSTYNHRADAERNQCLNQCNKIYDPDPNREMAVIQHCKQRC